jgi:hypothetical protein
VFFGQQISVAGVGRKASPDMLILVSPLEKWPGEGGGELGVVKGGYCAAILWP